MEACGPPSIAGAVRRLNPSHAANAAESGRLGTCSMESVSNSWASTLPLSPVPSLTINRPDTALEDCRLGGLETAQVSNLQAEIDARTPQSYALL